MARQGSLDAPISGSVEFIAEYHDYYINLGRLKGWITEAETKESAESVQQFFDELSFNLDRVEGFYCVKEDALIKRSENLPGSGGNVSEQAAHDSALATLSDDTRKLLCFALYNKEGFRRSAKMFDKQVGGKRKAKDGEKKDRSTTSWGFETAGKRKARHVFNDFVTLRESPEDDSKLAPGTCPNDSYVTLLDEQGEWVRVRHDAGEGWMRSKYLYELDSADKEDLAPRIVQKMNYYRFGLAKDRLNQLLASVGAEADEGADSPFARQVSMTSTDGRMGAPQSLSNLSVPLSRRPSFINVVLKKKEQPGCVATTCKTMTDMIQSNAVSLLYFATVTFAIWLWWLKGNSKTLNTDSFIVIWVTVITLTLLVWRDAQGNQKFSSDCVMIGATLTLCLMGVVDNEDAWAAFSNSVVLSVAALSVVGDAVSHTGFVDILFEKLIGEPKSLAMAMLRIYVPCAIGAATISNTAVMACCMPAIEEWAAKSGNHIGLFFMPISYIMLIAGTFAVFSTSTNLVAQGLLVAHDLPQLGTFELAVPALIMTLMSLVYLIIATPRVLHRFTKKAQQNQTSTSKKAQTQTRDFYVRVVAQNRDKQTLGDSGLLDVVSNNLDCIVTIERFGAALTEEICLTTVLRCGDILEMRVPSNTIPALSDFGGFLLLGLGATQLFATTSHERREFVEVVLDSLSPLVGKTIADAKTYRLYEGAVAGIRQRKLDSKVYNHGDQLIIESTKGFSKRFQGAPDFMALKLLGANSKHEVDTRKAYTSGGILLVMLICVAFSIFPLFACALAAIFALALTDCASVADMKKGVSLKVVLTIVGAFGLGNAIGKNGVAAALGSLMIAAFSPFGHAGLLTAVAVATVLLGIIFHGTAVVALMFPLCVHVAQESGIPLHMMIAVLCYSVACQMLSPVSYNTNLMAFAACPEYTFTDFPTLGAPLVVMVLVTGIPLCQWWFADSPLLPLV